MKKEMRSIVSGKFCFCELAIIVLLGLMLVSGSASAQYVVVEDFDSYENMMELLDVWNDYWGNSSGAEIFLEKDPNFVRDGNSVRLLYHNSYKSKGRYVGAWMDANPADLEVGPDWIVSGANTLVVHFRGSGGNSATINDKMWVELEDTSSNVGLVLYDGDANDVTEEWWHEWNIDLGLFDACGVDLTEVGSVSVGFGGYQQIGQTEAGGTGMVWFDDFRLYGDVEGKIYWTDAYYQTVGSNKIRRANLDGSEAEDIVTGLGFPRGIALDAAGGKMYWTEGMTQGSAVSPRIKRAELDGSRRQEIVKHGLTVPKGIDVDHGGGKVYWADYDGYKIQRANLDGTSVEEIISTPAPWHPWSLALDVFEGKIYFSTSTGSGSKIMRVDFDGSNLVEILSPGAPSIRGLELDLRYGKIYWTHLAGGKIIRSNLDGTNVEELVEGLGSLVDLALDVSANKMYWVIPPSGSDPPLIQRANLDGSNVETVVSDGLIVPRGIEVIPSRKPPELAGLEVVGPNEVAENFQAQYTAVAHYDDGSTADVTGQAVWSVEPNTIASIDENGLLVTEDVNIPGEYITIYAEYTEGGVTVAAEKEVDVFAVCLRGSALEFNGADDYVGVNDPDILNFGSSIDFTFAAWIKAETAQRKHPAIIGRRNLSNAHGYIFFLYTYEKLAVQLNDGIHSNYVSTGPDLRDDTWHHVAATGDRDGYLIFYIDGVQAGQNDISGKGNIDSTANLYIGWEERHSTVTYFNGIIDEVAIYNRALSAEEIQENVHNTLTGAEPNLIAYWDFDEGEGQVVYDMSGNGNDGYLGSDPCGADESDPNWVDSDAPVGLCTQPIADAGADQTVSAGIGCVAEVTLDGSDSNDADGDELTYAWLMGGEEIATGVNPVIELPLGEHAIELIVNDSFEDSEPDEVVITVEDVTPPEFSLFVEPNILWPPDNKMIEVRPEWEASDNCDERVQVSLVDISMNVAGDINDFVEIGDDGSIYLRAAKSKGGSGRIYTLVYEAVDDSGNVTEASATVTVPHSRGHSKLRERLRKRLYITEDREAAEWRKQGKK